jgi:hypothetical protein
MARSFSEVLLPQRQFGPAADNMLVTHHQMLSTASLQNCAIDILELTYAFSGL